MTLVLTGPTTASEAPPRRRPGLLAPVTGLLVVGLVLGWLVVGKQAPVQGGAWSGGLDARPLGDGVRATRHVLSVDEGEQVVLTSVRNGGRLPVTLLGLAEGGTFPWSTASFRDRGRTQDEVGYPSGAAAKDAVTATSLTLDPGEHADVLVRFDPPAHVTMADGTYSELTTVPLRVRHLGVTSTQRVPLLQEPLTLVGRATLARLEREGRFRAAR